MTIHVAWDHLASGRIEPALLDFERLITKGYSHYDVLFGAGMASLKFYDLKKAVRYFTLCIKQRPDHFEALYYRAEVYRQMKMYSQARADLEIVLREGFMLPGPDIGRDIGGRHGEGGHVAQQEGSERLLEGAGSGGRPGVGETEAALLSGGVFGLVVTVGIPAELDRVAALDPGGVVKESVVSILFVVGAVADDAAAAGHGHGRHRALRVGKGLGGVDVGAVGLGGQSDRGGDDAALREVEAGFVQQVGPDGVDGVYHHRASGGIGVGHGAAGDGGAGEEAAGYVAGIIGKKK